MQGADFVRYGCWAGLLGALFVGVGEGLLQLSPGADYSDSDYAYFAEISRERQTIGYFVAVLAAPLYVAGYWALSQLLAPASRALSVAFLMIGSYAFVVGAVWIGGRIYLAQIVHEIANGKPELSPLLPAMAAHNEPLVELLRAAMIPVSLIWVMLVAGGRSQLPRWMLLFNPAFLLGAIFGLYFYLPDVGSYILPVAMNVVHVIIFGLALAVARVPMLKATRTPPGRS